MVAGAAPEIAGNTGGVGRVRRSNVGLEVVEVEVDGDEEGRSEAAELQAEYVKSDGSG